MFINQSDKANWDAVKMSDSSSWNTYCGYSVQDKDTLRFAIVGSGACHGYFKSGGSGYNSRNKMQRVWSKRGILHCREELAKFYYTWLMNESPWSSAFVEKDYDKIKAEGFSLDPSLPHDYVASALVATRWLTERYTPWTKPRLPLYEELLKVMDPLWAFIGANLYKPREDKRNKYSFTMQSGHEMLPPNMSLENLKNFVSGNYDKSASFCSLGGYASIGTTWGAAAADPLRLTTLARNWRVKRDEKSDFNVFRKPDVNRGYPVLSFEELVVVINQIKEQVNDKKAA